MKDKDSQSPKKKRPESEYVTVEEAQKLFRGESTKELEESNKEKRGTIYSNTGLVWSKKDEQKAEETTQKLKKERRKGIEIKNEDEEEKEESSEESKSKIMEELLKNLEKGIEEMKAEDTLSKNGEEFSNKETNLFVESEEEPISEMLVNVPLEQDSDGNKIVPLDEMEEAPNKERRLLEDESEEEVNENEIEIEKDDIGIEEDHIGKYTEDQIATRILRPTDQVINIVMPDPTRKQKIWDSFFKKQGVVYGLAVLVLNILYQASVFTPSVSENQSETSYYYHKTKSEIDGAKLFIFWFNLIFLKEIVLILAKLFYKFEPDQTEFKKIFDGEIINKINNISPRFITTPELKNFHLWINDFREVVERLALENKWKAISYILIAAFQQFHFAIPLCNGKQKGDVPANQFEENCFVDTPEEIYNYFFDSKPAAKVNISKKEISKYYPCLVYFLLGQIVHDLQYLGKEENMFVLITELLSNKYFCSHKSDNKFLYQRSLLMGLLLTAEVQKGVYKMYGAHNDGEHISLGFYPVLSETIKKVFERLSENQKDQLLVILKYSNYGGAVNMELNSLGNKYYNPLYEPKASRSLSNNFYQSIRLGYQHLRNSIMPLFGKKIQENNSEAASLIQMEERGGYGATNNTIN